jgi:hypothetical protein
VVRTEKELVSVLKKSKTLVGLTFIEVILDHTDCNERLLGWGTAVANYNASKGNAAGLALEDMPNQIINLISANDPLITIR